MTPFDPDPVTARYLRTAHGRPAFYRVRTLHRWLGARQLTVADLTVALLQRFLQTLTPSTHSLHDYLQWLYERDVLSFDPDLFRRFPKKVPVPVRQFLSSLASTRLPTTCRAYATALRKLYAWLAKSDLDVRHLTREQLEPWFEQLHGAGFQAITRMRILMCVRAYFRWLDEQQRLRTPPDDLVRIRDFPKLPVYLPRPLAADADRELQRRLASSADPRAWMLQVMRLTGLRLGELRRLEYHCMRGDKQQLLLKVPLGKLNTERLVPLTRAGVALIQRLQTIGALPRPYLMPVPVGKKSSCAALNDVLRAHCVGLPEPDHITTHRLRHTFATEMLAAGMSLVGVMKLLGHRDFRMTLRYAAITQETVSTEYNLALATLEAKYQLPPTTKNSAPNAPDPAELLDQLSRWLRKQAAAPGSARLLLKRAHRLRQDVQRLMRQTKSRADDLTG